MVLMKIDTGQWKWKSTEDLEINSYVYATLICKEEWKIYSTNGVGKIGYPCGKSLIIDPALYHTQNSSSHLTQNNSKWMKT